MPNIDNINKLIARLQADDGSHFRMACFIAPLSDPEQGEAREYVECGTVLCIAGWANLFAMQEAGIDPNREVKLDPLSDKVRLKFGQQFSDTVRAAEWLGIYSGDGENEYATAADRLFYQRGYHRDAFDALQPAVRRAAGIRVLEVLRDTGEVDWPTAIDFAILL
jgi:hypothetical protein